MGLQHSSLSAPEGAAESKPHDVRKKRVAAQSHVTLLKDVDASVCDHHNTLFLGHLLEWMDAASCLAAEKHCSRSCVTLVMDDLDFTQDCQELLRLGERCLLEGKVARITFLGQFGHAFFDHVLQLAVLQSGKIFRDLVEAEARNGGYVHDGA
eukprot:TRINITY_DN29412_c1_g1_i2.p1 TRINITY_DN29412_c1_g1~~TRINITY_DN29412_c1_g1_i2.p1  ORF type:complete len:153 (+),score=30.05 TRINITY_DN29412_c1_g1_i2:67-525(+)